MGRFWNVTLTSGSVSSPVGVRFFFDPADTSSMRSAAAAQGSAWGLSSAQINGVEWFKTVGSVYDPSSSVTYSDVPGKLVLAPTYGTLHGVTYVEFSGITSFSGGTGAMRLSPGGYALPIALLSFTATSVDNSYISLNWSTASEIENKGFEIERSIDGVNFQKIAWIPGAGNSIMTLNYHYNDNTCEENTVYYYRLKAIDIDGAIDYSNIVSALLMGSRGFVFEDLRPNPAANKVVVNVISASAATSRIVLVDMLGRTVIDQAWDLSSGLNGTELDLTGIAQGLYNVVVYGNTMTSSKKLSILK
jgi:hypothetical protein